ncbi:DUF3592 domain-containing protein [Thiocystis violacea]|uniref:DUF3592 domain-containing protein n=1 Tax=Thiocystis violacea TaxID=13725 RepID=UPI001908D154|nr:DUF3592 domain-containing protein [Thiocystis violacea]MBK1722474.1 hypothetical protein [Thiocystis violacea]
MKSTFPTTLITGIFGLIGIALMLGAYSAFQHTQDFAAKATRTQGVVKELILSHSGAGTKRSSSYRPLVTFETARGERIEMVGKVGSNPPAYRPGERVTVLYLPDAPHNASIDDFWQQWFLVVLLTGMGSVFAFIGFAPIVVERRTRKRNARLMREGRIVHALYKGVEPSGHVRARRRRAYQIVAHWQDPMSGKLHVFRSQPIGFDPTDYVDRDLIDVHIDPEHPKHFVMDLSFLPELAD